MSFRATKGQLRSIFDWFREVIRINMLTGRATGNSRRLGFVEMTNDTKAARVFAALIGRNVNGRALKMHEACPKTDRSGPVTAVRFTPATITASRLASLGKPIGSCETDYGSP